MVTAVAAMEVITRKGQVAVAVADVGTVRMEEEAGAAAVVQVIALMAGRAPKLTAKRWKEMTTSV